MKTTEEKIAMGDTAMIEQITARGAIARTAVSEVGDGTSSAIATEVQASHPHIWRHSEMGCE
jgi:hypothetical protein